MARRLPVDAAPERPASRRVPFPTEAARDVLGLLRTLWAAESNVDRRCILAAAGHKVSQALQLAETDLTPPTYW